MDVDGHTTLLHPLTITTYHVPTIPESRRAAAAAAEENRKKEADMQRTFDLQQNEVKREARRKETVS